MKNKLITLFVLNTSLIFGQSYINYDLSNQFGFVLDNNQIIWDNNKKFDDLLIDRSTTYFDYKFSSFDFDSIPSDSLYVKSKFQYEFGDYGFDKLNIGLKKQSEDSSFEFIAMKKSFFGTYSEFANEDTSPLSLFYKIDYNTIFSKHNFYLSTGYFREEASFIFNNQLDLDTSNNKEFSDFLSITVGDIFIKNDWKYNFEINHVGNFSERKIVEYPINHEIDIERNRFNIYANNSKNFSIEAFLDNVFYKDRIHSKTYSRTTFYLSNENILPFGRLKYGVDYIGHNIIPNIRYNAEFGSTEFLIQRKNKSTRLLFDTYDFDSLNDEETENWDSFILNYYLGTTIDLVSSLRYVEASNIMTNYQIVGEASIPEENGYIFDSDDMLSLKTKISIPFKNSKIDLTHYHNFYDSLISSNRSHIIDINYHFKTSFVNQNLGIDGKISLRYLSENDSGYSFDYFKNMPISNGINYDEIYNIGLDLNVSISDVLLTVRLKNALDRLPFDGDYSINNSQIFNPMNSLLYFGIIWEFDD